MDLQSRLSRARQALANAAHLGETFQVTERPRQWRHSEFVRRQVRSSVPSREERARPRRRPAEEQPAAPAFARRPSIRTALATRSGLRQAILMQEILGQPKGLRMGERQDDISR